MHNSHMEKKYYKWVDINLSSSYVNVVHIIKLIKWTLGQVFFLLGFGPPNHAKWRAPKLFDKLKCEFKVKTTEEQGVGAHSLVCNTLGVKGRVGTLGWD
jgi:hypothetical protein